MIPKINRLPGYLISQALTSPKTLHSHLFTIKILEKISSTTPQIGFIVSTKISKKAVDRNKIKRLLRQSIKPYLDTLPKNKAFLIIAKPPIVGKTLTQIKVFFKKVLWTRNSQV